MFWMYNPPEHKVQRRLSIVKALIILWKSAFRSTKYVDKKSGLKNPLQRVLFLFPESRFQFRIIIEQVFPKFTFDPRNGGWRLGTP
jgi:hypothetical protein